MTLDSPSQHVNHAPIVALIGQGPMPVQCAKYLVSSGFVLGALHSPDAELRDWATEQNHQTFCDEFSDFELWCKTHPYDYLFSVVNFRLLKADLLRTPRGLAINYHDGPLPRYAGSNATVWALYNGEAEHGITWHVIEERVDTGNILKQARFPLVAGETQQSLDLKCYLNAMRVLRQLLAELKTGTYQRTPQDLSQRTFYRRSQLPPTMTGRTED